MPTITKTTLIAALTLGLASVAQAREGGTQPDLPMYNAPIAQQHDYGANAKDNPANAYVQQPRGRVTTGTSRPNRVFRDDPPGSAFQDWGIRESQ